MSAHSRRKGRRGENELAKILGAKRILTMPLVCFACLYNPPTTGGAQPAITIAAGAALCNDHLGLAGPNLLTSSTVIRLGFEWTPDPEDDDA